MNLDLQLFYLLNDLAGKSQTFDNIVIFFGDYFGYIIVVIFFIFLFFQIISKKQKIYFLFIAIISPLIARFGIGGLIRYFYHRPRPFMVLEVNQLLTNDDWSFPSGHATFFFAISTIVYLHNKKLGIFFFCSTILITISRVIGGIHYPTDIIGGMIIGISVSYFLDKISRQFLSSKEKMDL